MKRGIGSLSLKREIGVGDLLTATTIAISLVSVLVSWSLDRKLRLTNEANSIRAAAASVLGDLERSRDLFLSLYPQAQAVFVEASEIATDTKPLESRAERVQRARDYLWKRLNE